jgi:hypothetical protein
VTSIVVPAACFLVLLLQTRRRPQWLSLAAASGLFLLVFCTTVWIVDPYVRVNGLFGIVGKLTKSANMDVMQGIFALFDGQLYEAGKLPFRYLPQWILITTPILTSMGFGVGLIRLARSIQRPDVPDRRWQAIFVALCFFTPIFVVLVLRPVLFDAWRHFLFLCVPLILIAALGFEWGLTLLPKRLAALAVVIFGLGLVQIAVRVAPLHPYEYLFFNQWVGGLAGADGRYETDYWAKSMREAVVWLEADLADNPNTEHAIHLCGPVASALTFFPRTFVHTKDWYRADYSICFQRPGYDERSPDMPLYHAIQRDGVTLTPILAARSRLQR